MRSDVRARAEAAFKKPESANPARQDYDDRNAAIDANMMRLRAERLAREALMTTAATRRSRNAARRRSS